MHILQYPPLILQARNVYKTCICSTCKLCALTNPTQAKSSELVDNLPVEAPVMVLHNKRVFSHPWRGTRGQEKALVLRGSQHEGIIVRAYQKARTSFILSAHPFPSLTFSLTDFAAKSAAPGNILPKIGGCRGHIERHPSIRSQRRLRMHYASNRYHPSSRWPLAQPNHTWMS